MALLTRMRMDPRTRTYVERRTTEGRTTKEIRRCLKRSVTRRVVCNKRLGQAGHLWAFSLLTSSPGARAHYDRRRAAGDSHNAAARNLANRYFGVLHHCLQNRVPYDEAKANPTPRAVAA